MSIAVPEEGVKKTDLIEYKGGLWIVCSWVEIPDKKVSKPSRIIRLDGLKLEKKKGNTDWFYVVHTPIPKSLWEHGQIPPGSQFVVVEAPEIEVPSRSEIPRH
jgi:hypothetical protein